MTPSMYEDGRYAANHPRWHQDDSPWKARHLVARLDPATIEAMAALPTLRVAEVGCGAGGVLAEVGALLAARGVRPSLTGYDIAPHALALAAEEHPEVHLVTTDFRDDDARYDLGLMIDFLEHVERPQDYLAAAAGRFRWLLLHLPLDRHLLGRLTKGRGYPEFLRRDRGHLHLWTARAALHLVESSGWTVRGEALTPWGVEIPQGVGAKATVLRGARRVGLAVAPRATVRVLGGASLAVLAEPTRRP